MNERPILLAPAMALATVNDLKTQTRRLMKVQPYDGATVTVEQNHTTKVDRHGDEQPGAEIFGAWWADGEMGLKCPYGRPGDRLWGREAHRFVVGFDNRPPRDVSEGTPVRYECDGVDMIPGVGPAGGGWTWGKYRPPMFMPRWASRILLEITEVRAQRLQEISEADCAAEGWTKQPERSNDPQVHADAARDWYRDLWEQINGVDGPKSWAANPWVWAVSFRRISNV